MISELDLNIYQAIFQQKKLTEKYIGKVEFEWIYSEVHYTAECTVGVSFDLFDKTIVGILLVDEILSIEEIGDILGMNVIHNPENQQYKDDAEFDILRMALDNLYQYKMIEIGDTYYSSCRLTDIGKEYAQKGRKFKIENNKSFSLVYDHTTENHEEAKKVFQSLKGKNQGLAHDFDFLDESLMKQIAVKQASEVYNIEKGNSFTNPIIDTQKSQSRCLKIFVALLYDVENGSIRLIAYEPVTKKVNEYFTKYLNDNRLKDIIYQFTNENLADDNLSKLPQTYISALFQKQREIEKEIIENPLNAIAIAKDANQSFDYIDVEYFWNNLFEFIYTENTETFIFIPNTNRSIIKQLTNFPKRQNSTLFVCLQETGNEDIDSAVEEFCNEFETHTESIFADIFEDIVSFECFILSKEGVICLDLNDFAFDIAGEMVNKTFIHKYNRSLNEGRRKTLRMKIQFAEEYLPFFYEHLLETVSEEIETNNIHKQTILSFQSLDKKAHVFTNLQESEEVLQQILQIEQKKNKFIASLKEKHQQKIQVELQSVEADFEKQEFSNLENLQAYREMLQVIENELFDDYKTVKDALVFFKGKIKREEQLIKDEILAKTYIIDTNVFIEDPEIISKIDSKHYVAVTLTVIEELDKLKTKEKTKEKAIKAIKNIREALTQPSKQKKPRVKKAKANLNLLPEELQKKSGDNYLLSMAIMYEKENPVILTIDKNLQSKAIMLDIKVLTLKEFLGIADEPTFLVLGANFDYKTVFAQIQPNKDGKYQISRFIELLKKQNSNFDYKALGFKKAGEFVESLGIFEVTENQFMNLKS